MPTAPHALIELSTPEHSGVVLHLDDADTKQVGPRTFRKRILRYGRWAHKNAPGGVLTVDREYADKLVDNFNSGVWDHVTLPYGHPKGEAEGAVNSAGEAVALEATDDGVWATLAFTDDDAKNIGKKVRGCSAGIISNYTDHEIGGRGEVGPVLAHIALTNEPYIKGLGDFAPVQLSEDATVLYLSEEDEHNMTIEEMLAALKADHSIDVTELQETAAKVPTLEQRIVELEEAAAKAPATPAPEEVKEEATKELVTALGGALSTSGLITLSEGQEPSLQDVLGAITDGLKAGRQSVIELAETKADHAVADAIKAGKALPTQAEALKRVYLSDQSTFESLLPDTPIVDLSEHGSGDAEGLEDLPAGFDVEAEVSRLAELATTV